MICYQAKHISLASRRRLEDSEHWQVVGQIDVEKSVTDIALFFGAHHSVISQLWKQFQTSRIVVRRPVAGCPRVTIP